MSQAMTVDELHALPVAVDIDTRPTGRSGSRVRLAISLRRRGAIRAVCCAWAANTASPGTT
jgi:hypothetical protein